MANHRIINFDFINKVRSNLESDKNTCDTLIRDSVKIIDELMYYIDSYSIDRQLMAMQEKVEIYGKSLKELLEQYIKWLERTAFEVKDKSVLVKSKLDAELSKYGLSEAGSGRDVFSQNGRDNLNQSKVVSGGKGNIVAGRDNIFYGGGSGGSRTVVVKPDQVIGRGTKTTVTKRVVKKDTLAGRIYNAVGELFGLRDNVVVEGETGLAPNAQSANPTKQVVGGGASQAKINLVNNVPASSGGGYGGTSNVVNHYYNQPQPEVGLGAVDKVSPIESKAIPKAGGLASAGQVASAGTISADHGSNVVSQTGLLNDNSNDVIASVIDDSNIGDVTISDSSNNDHGSVVNKSYDFNKTGVGLMGLGAAGLVGYGAYRYNKDKEKKEDQFPEL